MAGSSFTFAEKYIMTEIKTDGVPIKMWADSMDEYAQKEAENLANLPFAFKHIALMPDVHAGKGMPIGGVLESRN